MLFAERLVGVAEHGSERVVVGDYGEAAVVGAHHGELRSLVQHLERRRIERCALHATGHGERSGSGLAHFAEGALAGLHCQGHTCDKRDCEKISFHIGIWVL